METRSNWNVMFRLIKMVKPLTGHMVLAIVMGVLGNLCAIAIPVLGSVILAGMIKNGATLSGPVAESTAIFGLDGAGGLQGVVVGNQIISMRVLLLILIVTALLRGVLHYAEQNRNHYIAFRLLALIRDKVFGALRKLAPARLEGRDKGDLIAILTSDIELLEVFYAHTISPIAIAGIVSVIMIVWFLQYHILLGVYALFAYVIVGLIIPLIFARRSRRYGEEFRKEFGDLDAFVLDQIRGVCESINYQSGERVRKAMNTRTERLSEKDGLLKGESGTNAAVTTGVILLLDLGMLLLSILLHEHSGLLYGEILIATVTMMSSFGPVLALANLGTGLQSTFAAGNRVLDILDEKSVVEEIVTGKDVEFHNAVCDHITFSYDTLGLTELRERTRSKDLGPEAKMVLKDYSITLPENQIIGIVGKSGCGKSTLLKLMMRFWSVQGGEIRISDTNLEEINTKSLREMESLVTQETVLFHDSIEANLRIANPDATKEQIVEACKKANIHDYIMTLPDGYDTKVGELGDTLSGGEKQRLGIARAFLHDAPLILLDEPTSNLDSLNEAVILKSLQDSRKDKTIVIVSHRKSTMCIADEVYQIN